MTVQQLTTPVIDRAALALNDRADMDVQHVEVGGTPALVVDNVYRRPEYVRRLALDLDFHRPAGGYPGYFAFATISAMPALELVNDLMRDVLGHELGFTDGYRDDLVFAVMTREEHELTPGQRKPHTDGFCDYAGLIYLNLPEQCAGGTSFWRHRRTGLEGAPGSDAANPVLAKLAAASPAAPGEEDDADLPDGYLLESNATWERAQVLPMAFNRLVFYSSYLYHSPWYDPRDFGTALDERRLTQNLYFVKRAGG